jgi:imidazolonepropionase
MITSLCIDILDISTYIILAKHQLPFREQFVSEQNRILTNTRLATMSPGNTPFGLIDDGAVAIRDGMIAWAGPACDLPAELAALPAHDMAGRLTTPGLIDCHTHIVYAGNRAREFEMRLNGAGYEEIARAGGGIVSTVKATREASEQQLVETALTRLGAMLAEGLTTIEVKSGYGLDEKNELKMLRAARSLANHRAITVSTSYLGAHATPPEYRGREDAYIDEVAIPALKTAHAHGLADMADGFCEGIAFSPTQIARVFDAAKALGLPVKLHAEQLSNLGGARLAASYGAASVDHIEYLDQAGVEAIAASGTVAVLLPGAYYTLRETTCPPVDALRRAGVPIAFATDCNPGSSPLHSPLLAMNMACTLFGLTPLEALDGLTRNAARALRMTDRGEITPGKRADLAVWDVEHPAELAYTIGLNPLHMRIFAGVPDHD